jgi:glycosyltransferase involved in cell wall biosynthesis
MKNKKIKVVQITHDLALGGLQRVIVNICRTIDKFKFDISVLCLRELGCFQKEIESLGVQVTLIPQKDHGADYLSFLKVASYLKKNKPDVIHTHNTQPFIDGSIAAFLTGGKRIIHTDHARSFPDKWRYMFAEQVMSHFAHTVVGVSEHTSENLIKYEHISPSKIKTIPNGIDPSPFDLSFDKKNKRKELGISENGPILGVAVRLSEQKGISYLLKAMPGIIAEHPTVTLVIAGDGPLKHELINEANNLGIIKNVSFLGLRLDMAELLNIFDVYVMPSLWEGLPMVILEALAVGCPIVATDVGGIGSAVIDGSNGFLVESKNSSELENAIKTVLKNPDLQEKFSKYSKNLFYEKYDARIMTAAYESLYIEKK